MTKTYKVELTVNMHEGKVTSKYITSIHEVTAGAEDPDAKAIIEMCNKMFEVEMIENK